MHSEHQENNELVELLFENYLEEYQLNFLIDEIFIRSMKIQEQLIKDEVQLPEEFLDQLIVWWAAEDLKQHEVYLYFVDQVLIKENFAYLLRDFVFWGMKSL